MIYVNGGAPQTLLLNVLNLMSGGNGLDYYVCDNTPNNNFGNVNTPCTTANPCVVAGPTTIWSPPGQSQVQNIEVTNLDGWAATIQILITSNTGSTFVLFQCTLAPGSTLVYESGDGWRINDWQSRGN